MLADHAWGIITGTYEMKSDETEWMNEMSVEKRWNEICSRGKRVKPRETIPNLRFVVVVCYFNDGHALQLSSETVAVPRRMIYDGHMITGDECGSNFLIFVIRLRENPGKASTRKLTRPRIEPGPAAWEVTMVHLDHSGGQSSFCPPRNQGAKSGPLYPCNDRHFCFLTSGVNKEMTAWLWTCGWWHALSEGDNLIGGYP